MSNKLHSPMDIPRIRLNVPSAMTASLLTRKATPLNWTLQAAEANDFEKVRIEYSLISPPKKLNVLLF